MEKCIKVPCHLDELGNGYRLKDLTEKHMMSALGDTTKNTLSEKRQQREFESLCGGNYAAIEFYSSDLLISNSLTTVYANSGVSKHTNLYASYFVTVNFPSYFNSLVVSPARSVNCNENCWGRKNDTEIKLLEYIASKLNPKRVSNMAIENIYGEIHLYTKLSPCFSCDYVLLQFGKMFPNIVVNVYWEDTAIVLV